MPAIPDRTPLISVLINNYNYGRFVEEAISSALGQDYPQIEVVVVDDGSTDDSRRRIEAYGDRIRHVFQSNGGQAAAFNEGFAASHGDIICLLDSDDRFRPGKLRAIAEMYQSYPDAKWVFHKLELFGTGAELSANGGANVVERVDARSALARGHLGADMPATSALSFRRDLLARILPMPREIRITSDNFLKFAALGLAAGVVSSARLAEQRIHGANAYTQNPRAASLRGEIAMMTARHLRMRFPELRRFAHGVYARGLAQWLSAADRAPAGRSIALQYVRDLSAMDVGEVALRSTVNLVRRASRG